MPNKKAEARLFSISAVKSLLCILLLSAIVSGWACQSARPAADEDRSVEAEILGRGNTYIANGDYAQAHLLFSQFIEKFPRHPYVDDAAYRIAYLHVLADEENPYFDYQKASALFQNFIENYPNSRYIIACQNWLFVLRQIGNKNTLPKVSADIPATGDGNMVHLKNELRLLREENQRLKKSLEELQQAIER